MAISLTKGQKISIDKDGAAGLTKVVMGLGWDVVKKRGFLGFGGTEEVDLDASCLLFDTQDKLTEVVFFRALKSKDGSVVHTGDNRTGDGDGDDEQILVDLSKVSPATKTLVFTVNSFTGQSFAKVANAKCRLLDGRNQSEIATFNLSGLGTHTAQIMAKIYRHNGEWKMQAIGEVGNGVTFEDLLPQIMPFV